MDNREQFLKSIVGGVGHYSSPRRLRSYIDYMIGDCTRVEKALDIGGGAGVLSLYISSQGAKKVVLLEPEMEGSTRAITDLFRTHQKASPNGEAVELCRQTFQEYDPGDDKFDLIVSANTINHLNEPACIDLKTNPKSYAEYIGYFERLYDMMSDDGRLVISDCSPHNFFGLLGLTSPLAPTIEWEKHQSPYLWTKMLAEVGFVNPEIKWSSYNTLGSLGRFLMGNALINYFTMSHFKFTMWKPAALEEA